jgi:HEPN domain-containing protein
MKMRIPHAVLALLGVAVLGACDTGTDVRLDELTAAEHAELEVLTDQGSFEVGLEMSEITNNVATELGVDGATTGRLLRAEARALFDQAREAMQDGDRIRALDAARRARILLARALVAAGGEAAVEALIERIEALALTADDEVFDDPEAVRARLEEIAADARELLDRGDTLAAAARALLGEQVARFHRGRRDHSDIATDRARLAVDLARSAVALAERLLADDAIPTDATTDRVTDRNRWLYLAKELLARSERALENGYLRRAVHLAHHAQWAALKAVILPGGVTEAEIRAIADLAQELLAQATEAVGDDPTELEQRLLTHAERMIALGLERLEMGEKRGVAALWRAAVVCHWLLT